MVAIMLSNSRRITSDDEQMIELATAMADNLSQPAVDQQPTQKPDLERVREWKHTPDGGLGKDCDKSDIPIYAAPTDIPKNCDGRNKTWPNQPCESDSWNSNGIVMRDKNNGRVVIREPKP